MENKDIYILTSITTDSIRAEIINEMMEWCGATYFSQSMRKTFTISDVGLDSNGFIAFRSMANDGFEYLTNAQDMNSNRSYLNIQKP